MFLCTILLVVFGGHGIGFGCHSLLHWPRSPEEWFQTWGVLEMILVPMGLAATGGSPRQPCLLIQQPASPSQVPHSSVSGTPLQFEIKALPTSWNWSQRIMAFLSFCHHVLALDTWSWDLGFAHQGVHHRLFLVPP